MTTSSGLLMQTNKNINDETQRKDTPQSTCLSLSPLWDGAENLSYSTCLLLVHLTKHLLPDVLTRRT